MRLVISILAMIVIVQSAHHLRFFKSPLLKGQTVAFIEKQVQYIDDDVTLNTEPDVPVEEKTFEEINVQDKQVEVQRDPEEAAAIQVDEEQKMSSDIIDELDRKEQEEYDRLKKQTLQEQQLNDDGSYLSSTENDQNVYMEAEDAMPIDVVEHQLTPAVPKDPIPDQKGVESPFAPADNSLPYTTYDSESGFEVRESDIRMEGAINPNEVDGYLAEQEKKQIEHSASFHV